MTTYYVDPGAAGDNNGTSWTHAWTSLQSAADTAAAGDTVYCRGTQNLSAAIDFDTNSGTYDGGYIKFVGCNASGVNDGSYFTLNGQDNSINGIYVNGKSFIWLENFKIHSCDGTAGLSTANAYADHWNFVNCWFHDNDGYGCHLNAYMRYPQFSLCKFTANTASGCYRPGQGAIFSLCQFRDNVGASSRGLELVAPTSCFSCIFHNNGAQGLYAYGAANLFANCVFNGNAGHGAEIGVAGAYSFVGCRFTNNNASGKYGLYTGANIRPTLLGCYFGNNSQGACNQYDILPVNGSTANVVLAGSETDHGYTTYDPPSYDFNLDATKAANTRSIAIQLP
jgi:hypothetical protein